MCIIRVYAGPAGHARERARGRRIPVFMGKPRMVMGLAALPACTSSRPIRDSNTPANRAFSAVGGSPGGHQSLTCGHFSHRFDMTNAHGQAGCLASSGGRHTVSHQHTVHAREEGWNWHRPRRCTTMRNLRALRLISRVEAFPQLLVDGSDPGCSSCDWSDRRHDGEPHRLSKRFRAHLARDWTSGVMHDGRSNSSRG